MVRVVRVRVRVRVGVRVKVRPRARVKVRVKVRVRVRVRVTRHQNDTRGATTWPLKTKKRKYKDVWDCV